MMKRMRLILLTMVFALFVAVPAMAQDYAAAIKLSTMGANLELVRSFSSSFNVRLGVADLSYNATNVASNDQLTVDGDLKLLAVTALADWFPFQGSFRLSGGLVVNLNKISMVMTPVKTYNSGNIIYTPATLGQINADVTFNKVAPYLGIGFGNPTAGSSGFGLTFDLGTYYQQSPLVSMSATKLLQPMESQSGQLQDNLRWFKFYPVLSVGLRYKF
jgi:hypothetical protein